MKRNLPCHEDYPGDTAEAIGAVMDNHNGWLARIMAGIKKTFSFPRTHW